MSGLDGGKNEMPNSARAHVLAALKLCTDVRLCCCSVYTTKRRGAVGAAARILGVQSVRALPELGEGLFPPNCPGVLGTRH
jgi:hypothetical protein